MLSSGSLNYDMMIMPHFKIKKKLLFTCTNELIKIRLCLLSKHQPDLGLISLIYINRFNICFNIQVLKFKSLI